ncbi:hypothetical protein QMA10_06410 [Arthrobacter sp. APC 3897]|uniref:hypothetical protein n=1 Tax=Arthrobacter sp. APC 3897 TaxID=3035204 RepID=UPI0025B4F120|nr:hypothetical protein [Arthrobacter sp. APC 3897]MDN3481555.1 hypothetical protein [Arthrobacter sp. APC 3897]
MTRPPPAESTLRRVLAGSAGLFRGDDYPDRLAEAAAGTQLPIATTRRIAVAGSRGGAGRTTVTALLARIYAAMRADAVAAVDNAPEGGTLGLRLGVPDAPPLDAVAARLEAGQPASVQQLAALLAVAGPPNLLVTGRRNPHAPTATNLRGAAARNTAGTAAPAWTPAGPLARNLSGGPVPAHAAASLLSRTVSRYCPVTVFDCGAGPAAPAARWALENSHLALFVTPAGTAAVADAVHYSAAWHLDPLLGSVPLLVLVVQGTRDGAESASRHAERLRRSGIAAAYLGYDRHLAAGTAVNPSLLSRRTRLEAVSLAAQVLSLAVSGTGPRRPAAAAAGAGAGCTGSAGFTASAEFAGPAQAGRTPA